ncbi:MAG: transcriptional regulator NrdR [Deltaproteobacteria bacterium]|nr:transcriptional regulator NrdR [Deltaproteobacteria bacterium]
MKCPFCSNLETKVIDSRVGKDGTMIRRRRECEICHQRHTTYERVEETLPFVVKKDGRREPFDRMKVMSGFQKACEKRPIPIDTVEGAVTDIEMQLIALGEKEVDSNYIGELVMNALRKLDDVAYVRFASVYRAFKDIGEFVELIRDHENTSSKAGKSVIRLVDPK